ncbi:MULTISPECIES: hypothetical protein [unclassified Rhizobium]|uniref:hypothetical protein n=1 Tax=unclassified Rhizobium TaxID=2613769 RepID=UPI001619E26F|nr:MULTISPECIES: hypothetical protein [unclassified Rhizobium]MBB3288758.1 hypothetical protein [Rhizobium sp. BK252]MBB3403500.1 hypothetical protein [Rhizobium sp. BK289]MBB3416315.1 hypothetical protein [Rhizobium sp. BK284]MBB3483963.1 hypothetical protein [Rhizobium sp. BK347]
MRDYTKVSPLIWRDKRFRSLASSDARLAMLYFVTCEHQNSTGCYRLPDAYAAVDLGWELDRFIKAREAVVSAGLILTDADSSEIFVVGWYETNTPTNDKHAIGTSRLIAKIESDQLREAAEEEFLASEQKRLTSKPSPGSNLLGTGFMNGATRRS